MTENYVGALVEVEVDPEYIVRLRVTEQDEKLLGSSGNNQVTTHGRKVTVIEPAPIPEPLNGEVWRSQRNPELTYTWDSFYAAWTGNHLGYSTRTHPSTLGYVKIAEGVA